VQALLKPVVQTSGKVPAVALVQVALGSMAPMEPPLRMTVWVATAVTGN